jgi:PTH1 family peptidyl-tRNA hydrolase
VDLLLGATKLSWGRNSGGHKGVESVMRALKTKHFWRMRIGVQKKRRVKGQDLVLQKFRGDETALTQKVIRKSQGAIAIIAANGPEYAMNVYNQ